MFSGLRVQPSLPFDSTPPRTLGDTPGTLEHAPGTLGDPPGTLEGRRRTLGNAPGTLDDPLGTLGSAPVTLGSSPSVSFLRHPRARRYRIRVRSDGSVLVTIPRRGSKRDAEAFLHEQQEWVVKQQHRVAVARQQQVSHDLTPDQQRALRLRARHELPARLLELAGALGLTVGKVSIRNQRCRWGSCSPSGAISLNWRLVTMPDEVRDYVMYHELMHLKRMDHSPQFWRLVADVCPGYQSARAWLRRHGR